MNIELRDTRRADPRADAAAWLDEDAATIAALSRGIDDDLLPGRDRRRVRLRVRRRVYGYVRGLS